MKSQQEKDRLKIRNMDVFRYNYDSLKLRRPHWEKKVQEQDDVVTQYIEERVEDEQIKNEIMNICKNNVERTQKG